MPRLIPSQRKKPGQSRLNSHPGPGNIKPFVQTLDCANEIAMLIIRKEQLAVLEAHMLGRFRERLLRHLRTELPAETQSRTDEQLFAMIDDGLRRGRGFGVTTERDLTLFVDLMFLHSPKFDEAPDMAWARNILMNHELDGETKMSLIYQRLAAQQQPDPDTGSN